MLNIRVKCSHLNLLLWTWYNVGQRVKSYQAKNFLLPEDIETVDTSCWRETVTSKYTYQNINLPTNKVFSTLADNNGQLFPSHKGTLLCSHQYIFREVHFLWLKYFCFCFIYIWMHCSIQIPLAYLLYT